MKEDFILAKLKEMLPASRYRHSLNVARIAEKFAQCYGADSAKARLAGLLHDCARGMSKEETVQFYKRHRRFFFDGKIVAANPVLLHSQIGAYLAKTKFKVKDKQILRAIALHTTGDRRMSVLDKIIYLADLTSPERRFPERNIIYRMAFRNLNRALLLGLISKIEHVLSKHQGLYIKTVEAYNGLIEELHRMINPKSKALNSK